jgi:cytochrome b involved in lipid metabolism
MRRIALIILGLTLVSATPAFAHKPVLLLNTDTTAAKGPLLVDGTISFAVRASFTKAGQTKAFRAALKAGDELALQYLIVDKKPESALKSTQLPQVTVTSPSGAKFMMKINERTKFFEPYGQTNYLYLARYNAPAEPGIYSIVIKSKAKSAITLAMGEKEIPGDVSRDQTLNPQATPLATPSKSEASTPAASPSPSKAGYTMEQVKANNGANRCWSVIDGNVYNLTAWIGSHPGGQRAIESLCGVDGTSSYMAQHRGQSKPTQRLESYLLGPLAK